MICKNFAKIGNYYNKKTLVLNLWYSAKCDSFRDNCVDDVMSNTEKKWRQYLVHLTKRVGVISQLYRSQSNADQLVTQD